jgi:hypothetical protein
VILGTGKSTIALDITRWSFSGVETMPRLVGKIRTDEPSWYRYVMILSFCLVLFGCTDRGVLGLTFTDGTTPQQAEQLVNHLGLSFQTAPAGTPLRAVIFVPVGAEDEYIEKLEAYPTVKRASRHIVKKY